MNSPMIPRGALITLTALAIAAFAGCLAAAAVDGGELPALIWLPLAFVGALWLVPAAAAARRGESWPYVAMLALLVFVTESTFRARAWTDKSLDWQVLLKGGVWLAAGTMGLMHLGLMRRAMAEPPACFVGLLVGLMAVSAAWSPVPGYTLSSSLGFFCCLLFALATTQLLEEREVLFGLALGCALVVFPSLLVAPFSNSLAGPSPGSTATLDRLAGTTDHPIGLAEACASAIFLAAFLLARRAAWRWLWWLLVVGGLAGLVLSRSRMPAAAMLLAWVIAFCRQRGVLTYFAAASLAAAMAAGLVVYGLGFDALVPRDVLRLMSRSGEAREVLTLSGRLDIWRSVLHKVADAPWLGHGFGSGNVVMRDFFRWHLNHAHNAYLQALLYLGVVGLGLLLAAIWGQLRAFLRSPSLGRDSLAFYVLIMGLTEQGPLPNAPGVVSLIWMLTAGLVVAGRQGQVRAALPLAMAVSEAGWAPR